MGQIVVPSRIPENLADEFAQKVRKTIDDEILEELLDNPVFWGSDWTGLEDFLNRER
jgi:hypothetical protein